MVAVKERLKCQNCGNPLEDDEDDYGSRIVCILCGREHDSGGRLLSHPIGADIVVRYDGRHNENYGPRFPNER